MTAVACLLKAVEGLVRHILLCLLGSEMYTTTSVFVQGSDNSKKQALKATPCAATQPR